MARFQPLTVKQLTGCSGKTFTDLRQLQEDCWVNKGVPDTCGSKAIMTLCSLCQQAVSCPFIPTSRHDTIRLQCASSPATWSQTQTHTHTPAAQGPQRYTRKGVWLPHRDLGVNRNFSTSVSHHPPLDIVDHIDTRMGNVKDFILNIPLFLLPFI